MDALLRGAALGLGVWLVAVLCMAACVWWAQRYDPSTFGIHDEPADRG